MATHLTFPELPQVRLGLWTIKIKIHYYTGIPSTEIHIWKTGGEMHIKFLVDLTQEQIDWIVALVNRADVQGPDVDLMVINNSYVIYDIWDRRDIIAAAAGFDFRIWFAPSGDLGPDVMDKIIFTPVGPGGSQRILTNANKRDFVAALEDGNGWE
jgi:hypothetical protein